MRCLAHRNLLLTHPVPNMVVVPVKRIGSIPQVDVTKEECGTEGYFNCTVSETGEKFIVVFSSCRARYS
nr:unnamed protein product [Haemonchus contortus]